MRTVSYTHLDVYKRQANRGTLFLDEINSMEIGLQAKLLKAIEEQKIMRIGGTEQISVDVRIIAVSYTHLVSFYISIIFYLRGS